MYLKLLTYLYVDYATSLECKLYESRDFVYLVHINKHVSEQNFKQI